MKDTGIPAAAGTYADVNDEVAASLAAIIAGIQWKVAEDKTKEAKTSLKYAEEQERIAEKKETEANANHLAVIAEEVVKEDPTLALRIAEKAWRLHKNQAVRWPASCPLFFKRDSKL